ncbi:MAG: DUF169 domain-containing protein, partial [Bacteroidota bacterium]
MEIQLRDQLTDSWNKYFPGAELPVVLFYTNDPGDVPYAQKPSGHRCIFADIAQVRKGESLAFNQDNIGCGGGQKYAGYREGQGPDFEFFLSCGIEGKLEGERYKKDPETVREMMQGFPEVKAEGKSLIFKRWDKLTED